MPAKAVTITANFTKIEEPTYAITIMAGVGGSITVGANGDYKQGTVINISAATNSGYTFNEWTASNGGSFANKNSATTTFVMPASAVTITANFTYVGGSGGGGGGDSTVVPTKPVLPAPTTPGIPEVPSPSQPLTLSISLLSGKASKGEETLALHVEPYIQEGRTMVGVRDMATLINVSNENIIWDAKNKTVVIKTDDKEITFIIGEKYALVNGEKVSIDVAAQIKDGRTVLPMAHVARLLGMKIEFNTITKEASFTME
jgi:uncharacterized repeat protein (TIGR02543 family)